MSVDIQKEYNIDVVDFYREYTSSDSILEPLDIISETIPLSTNFLPYSSDDSQESDKYKLKIELKNLVDFENIQTDGITFIYYYNGNKYTRTYKYADYILLESEYSLTSIFYLTESDFNNSAHYNCESEEKLKFDEKYYYDDNLFQLDSEGKYIKYNNRYWNINYFDTVTTNDSIQLYYPSFNHYNIAGFTIVNATTSIDTNTYPIPFALNKGMKNEEGIALPEYWNKLPTYNISNWGQTFLVSDFDIYYNYAMTEPSICGTIKKFINKEIYIDFSIKNIENKKIKAGTIILYGMEEEYFRDIFSSIFELIDWNNKEYIFNMTISDGIVNTKEYNNYEISSRYSIIEFSQDGRSISLFGSECLPYIAYDINGNAIIGEDDDMLNYNILQANVIAGGNFDTGYSLRFVNSYEGASAPPETRYMLNIGAANLNNSVLSYYRNTLINIYGNIWLDGDIYIASNHHSIHLTGSPYGSITNSNNFMDVYAERCGNIVMVTLVANMQLGQTNATLSECRLPVGYRPDREQWGYSHGVVSYSFDGSITRWMLSTDGKWTFVTNNTSSYVEHRLTFTYITHDRI